MGPVKIYLCIVLLPLLVGCSNLSYYSQSITGHLDLMNRVEPIETVLARESTEQNLRLRLQRALEIRAFASEALSLPDNDSYKSYADLQRPYVVWTVVVAPRLSVKAQQSCFLIVGCLNYRGYFSEADARAYAEKEKARGMDVYVAGTRAYSTLGWFDDPLLNTILSQAEARMAEVLIHELAHQQLYIDDDSAFNEAFATAVAQEGVRRWFTQSRQAGLLTHYENHLRRRGDFNRLLLSTREQLERLYASDISEDKKLKQKKILFMKMKAEYQQIKTGWGGYRGYDQWMGQPLNNAHLALVATYHQLVPAFRTFLQSHNGNLAVFYEKVAGIAELPKQERQLALVSNTN